VIQFDTKPVQPTHIVAAVLHGVPRDTTSTPEAKIRNVNG
jgi:hypothetical protein